MRRFWKFKSNMNGIHQRTWFEGNKPPRSHISARHKGVKGPSVIDLEVAAAQAGNDVRVAGISDT